MILAVVWFQIRPSLWEVELFCFLIIFLEAPVPRRYGPLPAEFANRRVGVGSSSSRGCSNVRVVDGRVGMLSAAICNIRYKSWMQACTHGGLFRVGWGDIYLISAPLDPLPHWQEIPLLHNSAEMQCANGRARLNFSSPGACSTR